MHCGPAEAPRQVILASVVQECVLAAVLPARRQPGQCLRCAPSVPKK